MENLRSFWQRICTFVPSWIWTVVKGLVSAGLVVWLILGFDWNEVFATLATISLLYIVAWLAMWFLGFCLMALRLQLLLSVQKIHIPFRFALRLVFIAGFMGNFLPSSMGGDAFKFAFLARAGYSKSVTGVSIILDRLFNIAATFMFLPFILAVPGLLNLDVQMQHILPYYMLGIVFLTCLLIVGFVLAGRKVREHLPPPVKDRSIKASLHRVGYRLAGILGNWLDHPWILVAAMIIALITMVLFFCAGWLLARGLGMNLAMVTWFAIQACLSVLVFLPISFNGLGLQEVSMVYLMANVGMGEGQSLALALLMRVLVVLISLVGAYGLIAENRITTQNITNHM